MNPNQPLRMGQAELAAIFRNILFLFILQMLLASYIGLRKDGLGAQTGKISNGNEVTIIFARFICAFAIHKLLEKELFQAIRFMKFTLYKMMSWRKRFPMLLISLMQLIAGITIECLNIVQVCSADNILDMVLSSIMFAIIAKIDDLYA
jgi:hypothetical protein